MATFRVQYDDGPTLDIDAPSAERAWDIYKEQTKSAQRPAGVRRRLVAEARGEIDPPVVEEISPGGA